MKILHTSDWHIGRNLYGRKRNQEYIEFLTWLDNIVVEKDIDVLLIAGDVFDTGTPGPLAQKLYYNFLSRISKTNCKHIVVIGGNHDSPTLLNAPKGILSSLNVHVVGSKTEDVKDEVLVFKSCNGDDELIVCAIPFLRDRDIRDVEAGESVENKTGKLIAGIKRHYNDVISYATSIRGDKNIPVVAMGHMFVAGGVTDEGVRDLYVGTLGQVGMDIFPKSIDYFALGHLHIPQIVNKDESKRYSGSPIPMGFGEANQKKIVLEVEFSGKKPVITEIDVPVFQELLRIKGNIEDISKRVESLKVEKSSAWLEIEYNGSEPVTNLREIVDELIKDTSMEVRIIKNKSIIHKVLESEVLESLENLKPEEVFTRCLEQYNATDRDKLSLMFNEVLDSVLLGEAE